MISTYLRMTPEQRKLWAYIRYRLGLWAMSEAGLVMTGENPYFVVTPPDQVKLIREWAAEFGVKM